MANKLCFSLLVLAGCPAQLSSPNDEAAAVENPPDAGTPADECVPQITQLLANPTFDSATLGADWIEELIDDSALLITDADGIVEHTPPYKAWLGGIEAPLGTLVEDAIEQDVTIPANTTQLVITGMYDVRTDEAPTTSDYDNANLLITELDGTVIETVLAVSNTTPKTAWTMFDHAITQNLSGKTVRVLFVSSNDELDVTSFYLDSLALTATHGCAGAL